MNLLMFFGVKWFGISAFMWIFIGVIVIDIIIGVINLFGEPIDAAIGIGIDIILLIIFLILHVPILPILITFLVISIINSILCIYIGEGFGMILQPVYVICNIIGLILFCTNGLV